MSIARINEFLSNHPLTRNNRAAAWGRFLWWQMRSRISHDVIVDWVAGQRFVAHRGMTGFTGNIYAGLHEAVDMLFLLHLLRPGDLLLDVGANVGSYTVLASGVSGARTMAFEPDPDTVAQLRRNVELNGLGDLVELYPVALGASETEVRFTVGGDTVNHVASPDDKEWRTVRQARLDDITTGTSPLMMKIDVEGYEEEVLKGAEAALAAPGLRVVAVETVTSRIEDIFASYGFTKLYYDPFRRQLSGRPYPDKASNQLFVRDVDYVTARVAAADPIAVVGMSI
jgi:FkbM family methyltransferase